MLNGQVAIVTGASRGIGRAIALQLAKEKAKVVINYTGNQAKAEEVVAEIKAFGGEAIAVKADVADMTQVTELVETTINTFGSIEILVNNAGITRDGLLMRLKEEDWDAVINTNLKGTFNCSKAVVRQMMKQRYGKIINISSVIGALGNAGQANYAAAKAGVFGFTKSLARELANRNITVNAIAPGFIETDMTEQLPETLKAELIKQIPLARFGNTEDIAGVVNFLVSKAADYMTGQTLYVDGGMVMS